MENQQIKIFSEKLAKYRDKIDKIDAQIIELLKARMAVVDEVGTLKKQQNEKFFIRSSREADMIKKIINQIDFNFSKSAIINIWRKIITSANISEQQLKIIFFNDKNSAENTNYFKSLIIEYYLAEVEIIDSQSIQFCFEQAEKIDKKNSTIAIFPISQNQILQKKYQTLWWQKLAKNKGDLKIFMKIPFYLSDKNSAKNLEKNPILFLLANKEAEKSSEDKSLIYIESDKKITQKNLEFSENNQKISFKIIDKNQNLANNKFYFLTEIEGFFDQKNIDNFSKKNKFIKKIKLLGHYPKEIKI